MSDGSVELSVSMVVFQPDLELLTKTVRSLSAALTEARASDLLCRSVIWVIDNGSADASAASAIDRLFQDAWPVRPDWLEIKTLRGHGNVGYGAGHDLAIVRATGHYHLILNPDVVLDPEAVIESIRYLEAHPQVGLVTPHAVGETGARQFLCKRYPSVLVLALRGFAPRAVQRVFQARLDHYEMRDLPEHESSTGIPIASGCYMFTRLQRLRDVGSFSSDYFLYFEDFDLSLRLGRVSAIAYVPRVRIVHAGGGAARKGWRHRRLFVQSAFTFFRRHGWKLW